MKNNIRFKSNNIAFKITFTALIVFLIAISILTGVSLKVTSKDMEKQMQMDGIGLAEEIADEIEIGNIAVNQMNNLLCDKIKNVSYLIGQTANLSNENLIKLANNTQITEVNIANPQGVIIYSNMDANIGYRYPDNHAVQAVLKGKEKNTVEEIRKSDVDGKYYKYGAVALDNGGIVQVGILADKVQELQSYVNTQKMVESIAKKENIDYAVVIDKNLVAVANSDKSKIGSSFEDKGSKMAAKEGKMYCSKYTENGETVYDVNMPLYIDGKHTGAIDIGISMKNLNNALKDIIIKSVIISLISFLVGGYVLSFIIKRMINPLKEVADIANKVSNGDLTCKVNIKGNDEISVLAKSFNIMIDNLRNITSKIQYVASNVSSYSQELLSSSQQASSASEQIAVSIQDIAAGAEKQVDATNEVSNNIKEVVYSMTKIQSEVTDVVNNANDTSKLALNGREKMNNMINQINTIKDSVNYSSNVMYELEVTSDEIGGIVQVINDIADQTNLLALNAAIEAARAGESGKGFAVVADEIRNLAEQSMKSAEKIRSLIIKTQENTKKALDSIGKGNKEADEGELIVKEVGISLKQILDGFDITKHKLYEVNENIIISNKNAEYIVGVVEQIEGVSTDSAANTEEVAASTQEQAATIEQISGAVEQLTNMAMDLEDIVKMFKI